MRRDPTSFGWSHPLEIDDSGVALLLEHWGGESIYFWQRNVELVETLKRIGRPRVVEVAAPLADNFHAHAAADAILATFARTLDVRAERRMFDLYSNRGLPRHHILAVHSEGEPAFWTLGRGHPATFQRGN